MIEERARSISGMYAGHRLLSCVVISAALVEWGVVRPDRLAVLYSIGLPGNVAPWMAALVAAALVGGMTVLSLRMWRVIDDARVSVRRRRNGTGTWATFLAVGEYIADRSRWWHASTMAGAGWVLERRGWWAGGAGICIAWWWLSTYPFPWSHPVMIYLAREKPALVQQWAGMYAGMVLISAIGLSRTGLAAVYVWGDWTQLPVREGELPPYPPVSERQELYVILGEEHHPYRPVPSPSPRWKRVPEKGLFAGTFIIGALGSGKTTCCIRPYAEQILGVLARDRERRAGAFVLEAKGSLCEVIEDIMTKYGRHEDFVELSVGGRYRYNPLNNDVDPYSLAYCITETANALFGASSEKFWNQATTDLSRFIITLHRALYDYVTFLDIYRCAIDDEYFGSLIDEACRIHGVERVQAGKGQSGRAGAVQDDPFGGNAVVLELHTFVRHQSLLSQKGVRGHPGGAGQVYVEATAATIEVLTSNGIPFVRRPGASSGTSSAVRRHEVAAVAGWYDSHWKSLFPRLKSAIVQNLTVFLALFDADPVVQWTFCPPAEVYGKQGPKRQTFESVELGAGIPLPRWCDLIEQGKVVSLNMPVAAAPGLARIIGTMLKLDYQRAVLDRIRAMTRHPERVWRPTLFLCDEYQNFASVGEVSGDDRFFAMSREAKCIPMVATQSVSSMASVLPENRWRTLMAQFRNLVVLAMTDDASAKYVSDRCGREDMLFANYGLSESTPDAKVSWLSGRAFSEGATLSTSTSYSVRRELVFEPKTLQGLRNGQAVALVYDGVKPSPPSLLYTKPYWLDPNVTYFAHVRAGRL